MQLVSILATVAGSSVLTGGGCGGIQRDGKGLVEVRMHLPVIVCGELGCFFYVKIVREAVA